MLQVYSVILVQMDTNQKFKQIEFIEAVERQLLTNKMSLKAPCDSRGNVCSTESNFIRIFIT